MRGLEFEIRRTIESVERNGWIINTVASNEPGSRERFAYTIGLMKTYGWPEMICFGLESDVATYVLNNTIRQCLRDSIVPKNDVTLDDVLEGYYIKLANVGSWDWDYIGWAQWYAGFCGLSQEKFECLQLLWPDNEGYFPDDPKCQSDTRSLQTPLKVST